MGLHRFKPPPSGRMGALWTLATIRDAAVVEFGCMGHMLYSGVTLKRAGVHDGCRFYSTHLDETDIALGGTDRLRHTLSHVVAHDRPRVIFLLPSAIPEVIGVDLPALAQELQPDYPGVRLVPLGHGGFDIHQHRGIEEALLLLAQTLPLDIPRTPRPTFNLVGSCADLFRFQADAAEIVRLLQGAFGLEPLCILTSDTSLAAIESLGGAHINLVLRREGEPAARHLHERFGTPWHAGRPYGVEGTARWLDAVARLLGTAPDTAFLQSERDLARRRLAPVMPAFRHRARSHPEEVTLSLGGHADVVRGIRGYACGELSFPAGACWCDCPAMATDDIPWFSEDEWTRAIEQKPSGLLMASGEALDWAGRERDLQISNPDTRWRLHPHEPPLVGFRGAVHLANLWINATPAD